jgi:FkbM family methyltransferase
MLTQTVNLRGHTILDRLNADSIVLDCGANRGDFAARIRERYGCRVVSLEPNPKLFAALPTGDGISSLPYALGSHDGTMNFQIGENDEASSLVGSPSGHHTTLPVQVRSLESIMRSINADKVDLVKLDVEGAEVPVLLETPDEVLRKISQFTIEYHDFLGYITPEQINQTMARMKQLGFSICVLSRHKQDVLMINQAHLKIGAGGCWWITGVENNVRRVARLAKQKLHLGS